MLRFPLPVLPTLRRAACILVAILLVGCAEDQAAPLDAPTVPPEARIQAVTLDARHPPGGGTIDSIQALGATHITLVTFAFQRNIKEPQLRVHTDGDWYSESDRGIRALAKEARQRDMRLILKPHVWVGHYSAEGQSRADIAFDTEDDWSTWETQYRNFILHYAHLADEVDASMLVVGTELHAAVRERPAFWRGLIDTVRTVYDGPMTYAANWYDEYQDVTFWDALDYVGVQAYFPLSDADDPSLDALRRGWSDHQAALQRIAARTNRPVLFTELGYRSVPYAAAQPWKWPERDEQNRIEPDTALQARLYQAFFDEIAAQPWFAGAILWKWHPTNASRRTARLLGFTPQNKPAEQVIQQGFVHPDS